MNKLSITSEIGKLEKVIIHKPGYEIELMTPDTAHELLFDDILDLSTAVSEHKAFVEILKKHSNVYEVKDLLRDIVNNENQKAELLKDLINETKAPINLLDALLSYPNEELVKSLFEGIFEDEKNITFGTTINPKFSFPPLPNFFFTRDTAIVINNHVLSGSMANHIRTSEATIMRHIFRNHPDLNSDGFYFEEFNELHENSKFEGGDILVLRSDILAIGLSERTTMDAVEQLIEKLKEKDIVKHIFTVNLPKQRAMIHLDMVFTMLDHNYACIYEPAILGEQNLGVKHIDISNKINKIETVPNLIAGLKTIGLDIEPIRCGGNNRINQDREQWMCGANFLSLAPGKIIGYARSVNTFEEIEKIAKIPRIEAADILSGKVDLNDYDRYAIAFKGAELSRGGGGARCMTLPVLRKQPE
ncbi:MAG: arginine deiminase family protein [Candidatus Cloacimonetes bacterium]|nr:arginine deiminase family protein [Candidatus Cloacimonadota bacterium]